ncbi:ATP-binding cassette domain-containing protein [Vibrio hippocampi]|uniref:ATP-binding cassette domain-containing protein n=1 Tax=Vibrio hippocampi TaxID=654686 RepID=UPI003F49DC28
MLCYIITLRTAVNVQPILSVDHLTVADSQRVLFQDISFELYQGEIVAIMGPSGIGKSMLSKAIAGFLPQDIAVTGSIIFNNDSVADKPILQRSASQRPAVIFQDALQALNPLARIEQQLALAVTSGQSRLNQANKSHVTQLLSQLGFSDPSAILPLYPSQLSGGQRQRICIAMALLGQANLLIADEPTSALDPVTETEILSLFNHNVKSQHKSGLLITHDLHAAMACDKLVVIADGSVVAYGTPEHAITQGQHPYCQQLAELLASV